MQSKIFNLFGILIRSISLSIAVLLCRLLFSLKKKKIDLKLKENLQKTTVRFCLYQIGLDIKFMYRISQRSDLLVIVNLYIKIYQNISNQLK